MSDLKALTFFITFAFLFIGILGMIGANTNELGEYQTPEGYNQTETDSGYFSTPDFSMFQTLKDAVTLDTGVFILDSWALPIFAAIIGFIIFRALRGQ